MWQMQIMLGEKVNSILIDKFKNLSFSLVLLQISESIVFILLAKKSVNFIVNREIILRFSLVNLTALLINLFLLVLFIIIEMKTKKSTPCPLFL